MTDALLAGTDFWTLATLLGLGAVTVLTRCFFFISSQPWKLPAWVSRGLQYAPVAALAAVVVPLMLIHLGQQTEAGLEVTLVLVQKVVAAVTTSVGSVVVQDEVCS